MPDNLIYYSANSSLSHFISKTFYNSIFYVWCSPVFDPASLGSLDPRRRIPGSSSPHKIYKGFLKDVEENDLHSSLISQNRSGLKKGALEKYTKGDITDAELNIINTLVDEATISEFEPLLYLLPSDKVKVKLTKVSSSMAAHPLSEEYIIDNLEEKEFEIIKF